MAEKVIVTDVDGVLFNTPQVFVDLSIAMGWLPPEFTAIDYRPDWANLWWPGVHGLPEGERLARYIEADNRVRTLADMGLYTNLEPLPGALEAIARLTELGAYVVACTSRPTRVVEVTRDLIWRWFSQIEAVKHTGQWDDHQPGESPNPLTATKVRAIRGIEEQYGRVVAVIEDEVFPAQDAAAVGWDTVLIGERSDRGPETAVGQDHLSVDPTWAEALPYLVSLLAASRGW